MSPATDISTAVSPFTRWDALYYIFHALRRRAPWVLERLRDSPEGTIQEWAAHHHLSFPFAIESMTRQHAFWREHPEAGAALRFLDSREITVIATTSDAHHTADLWLQDHLHSGNLPNPKVETLREWIARATQLYQSRMNGRQRPPKPRWREFARRCDWFVQRQVLGWNPSQIRRFGESADRRAIERGSDSIVRLLGGTPRPRQRGTPKRKIRIGKPKPRIER